MEAGRKPHPPKAQLQLQVALLCPVDLAKSLLESCPEFSNNLTSSYVFPNPIGYTNFKKGCMFSYIPFVLVHG